MIIKMAKKWQKIAAERRLSWSKPETEKGHFVVYTSDRRRFMIPLTYLKSGLLKELFRMAEDEYGVTASGPIMFPCDSRFMEYAITMIERHVAEDLEKAMIMSLATCKHSPLSNDLQEQTHQQLFISSF